MKNSMDIFNDYLQMRQSSAAREQADMAMLQQLAEELRRTQNALMAKEKEVELLKQIISEMKEARPVTIGTLNGSYIETINQANLCQPSSISSTEPTLNTSIPTSSTNITRLNNE